MKSRRRAIASICTLVILVCTLASGCGKEPVDPAQRILGRWRVTEKEGINVPHSFFWAMMDFVEFRPEGVVQPLQSLVAQMDSIVALLPQIDRRALRHSHVGQESHAGILVGI